MGGKSSKAKAGASPAKQATNSPSPAPAKTETKPSSPAPAAAAAAAAPATTTETKPVETPAPEPAAVKKQSVAAKRQSEAKPSASGGNGTAEVPDTVDENVEEEQPVQSQNFPIILDTGSFITKAGFSDSIASPQVLMPTVIGRVKNQEKVEGWLGQKDIYIGQEADDKSEELAIKWPVVKGIVPLSNWEEMEKIWHNVFYSKLRVKPSEHVIVVTEAPLNPKANRERLARIMFNTFKSPALYIGHCVVFALYATGRNTGTVVELGDSSAHVVSVYQGNVIPNSIMELAISGHDLTEYMYKMITERGLSFGDKVAHDISRQAKERFGYVSMNYDEEFEKSQSNEDLEKTYEGQNGETVTVGTERFRCPEAIFQPQLLNPHLEQEGAHLTVNGSIAACDAEIQSQLYGSIVLSGGSTMFEGFADRMKAELGKIAGDKPINIIRRPDRKYLPWIGAAMFANEPLVTLLDKCVTIDEYKSADGVSLINTKFN